MNGRAAKQLRKISTKLEFTRQEYRWLKTMWKYLTQEERSQVFSPMISSKRKAELFVRVQKRLV